MAISRGDLRERAEAWLAGDPDERTREELAALLVRGDAAELSERFDRELEFGTAGLRGTLGAGPNRMNRAVVLRTTFGLARYLVDLSPDAAARGVVVGRDARTMSDVFANDVAEVLAAAGLTVHAFAEEVPTPLVAFAVKELGALAGVMVTASHNPAEYNGYKVYGAGGSQIVAPADSLIARAIAAAPAAREIPRLSVDDARRAGKLVVIPADLEARYVEGACRLLLAPEIRPPLAIVYTPLHGVGLRVARKVMGAAGFGEMLVVPEQASPDPAFPTTRFPNPEEPRVLDLALSLARERNADIVLANDPDADRLAVAVRDENADWVQLTGNQVGVLLGHYLLTREPTAGKKAVITTIVSSPMLARIASELGAHYEETLTGFKWIAARAAELDRQGLLVVFGYEEALGYMVRDLVRDKDGITAAALFAELAAICKQEQSSVHAYLMDLYRRFGLYVSRQKSLSMPGNEGAARIARLMRMLRERPPTSLAGHAIVESRDYEQRVRKSPGRADEPLALPPSDVLAYDLEGGARVVIRPSGTEPKLKMYLDHREVLAPGEAIARAEERAARALTALDVAVRDRIADLDRGPTPG